MASMRQIRSRIRVAKNIQQITKAMKMVAAARLRRAQEAVEASRPYANRLREVMARLASSGAASQHPLLRPLNGTPTRIGVVLISGDRGLAGSFNSNSIKKAAETVRDFQPNSVRFVTVGRRGAAFVRRRGYQIAGEHLVPPAALAFPEAKIIAAEAVRLFETGEVDAVYLVYTQFVSAMTQRTESLQLLPVAPPQSSRDTQDSQAVDVDFEPSAEEILDDLVPRYVDTLVFQGIVESIASFFGAQMTSMSSATDNAGKMIDSLTLTLNRARQAAITKEIAEIVGGADALKG